MFLYFYGSNRIGVEIFMNLAEMSSKCRELYTSNPAKMPKGCMKKIDEAIEKADILSNEAIKSFKEKNYADSVDKFEKAITLKESFMGENPSLISNYEMLALFAREHGFKDIASKYYKKIVDTARNFGKSDDFIKKYVPDEYFKK